MAHCLRCGCLLHWVLPYIRPLDRYDAKIIEASNLPADESMPCNEESRWDEIDEVILNQRDKHLSQCLMDFFSEVALTLLKRIAAKYTEE